jgi:hypothetical protein
MKKNLCILFLSLFGSIALGKPVLDFRFVIEEPLIKLVFFENKDHIEKEVARRLLPFLDEYLCFAEFQQNEALGDRFTVILHNINHSVDFTRPQDVVFFFELNGQNVRHHEAAESWLFINKSAYSHPYGDAEAFISKIVTAFTGKLRFEYHALVEKIFCNLIISKHAFLRRTESEWVLPLNRTALGIDRESLFEIVNEATDNVGVLECAYRAVVIGHYTGVDLPPDYRMGIRVKNNEAQDLCEIFSNRTLTIQVKEVLLKTFRRSLPASGNPVDYIPASDQN